jgi:hypothetical protein
MQRPKQVCIDHDIYSLCDSSTIYLYAANDPIIESSNNLKFAPYNVAYPYLDQQVATVGFDVSKYLNIYDQS